MRNSSYGMSDEETHARREGGGQSTLSELEVNTIELFVQIAHLLGISKSIGEIYGLLFVSFAPAPFEYVREKLRMSNGSASQGLRLLRSVGAIRTIYVPGDRRDHYAVETGLVTIATGFLRERIAPNISSQECRIERIFSILAEMPPTHRSLVEERLQILQSWRRQAWAVLPKLMECLRAGNEVFPDEITPPDGGLNQA